MPLGRFFSMTSPQRSQVWLLALTVACLTGLGSLSLNVATADWKEFRGPTGQGLSNQASLPVKWSKADNVQWKADLPGLAWSSPVLADGFIYLTTAIEDEEQISLELVKLKADDGRLVGRVPLFSHASDVKIHKKNSHSSPTPIIEGDRIYVHFGPYGTACVSSAGDVLWKQTLTYSPVHGNGGSPALVGDLLVICCDGGDQQFVAGLDTRTGEVRWRTARDTKPTKGFSFATPLLITVNGVEQIVCPGSDAVFAYRPQDGSEIWRVDYPDGYSVIPRPVYGEGLVFVCTGYNKPQLLAIDPTGTGNVTETHLRWKLDRQMPHSPSPVLVGSELYVVSDKGIASCLDAKTGEIHWQERLGGNYSASPLAANGRIYFQDENGTTFVVKAAKEFEIEARNLLDQNERTFASFAVINNDFLIRSESSLYRIRATR